MDADLLGCLGVRQRGATRTYNLINAIEVLQERGVLSPLILHAKVQRGKVLA